MITQQTSLTIIGDFIDRAARTISGQDRPSVNISLGASWKHALYGVNNRWLVTADKERVVAVFDRNDYATPTAHWQAALAAYSHAALTARA